MVRIPKIKRPNKHQAHVDRPNVVTGNFEMHYEDVLRSSRYALIAIVVTGMLTVAAFIPIAVNQSIADSQRVIVDVENGKISNPSDLMIVKGDDTAAGDGYIEFGGQE